MKKAMILLLFIPLIGKAQLAKGDLFLGGGFSLSTESQSTGSSKAEKNNTFSVTPYVGYLLNEQWAVGGRLGYYSSRTEEGPTTFKTGVFSLGPFARRYFKLSDQCLIAINGGLTFGRGTNTYTYSGNGSYTSQNKFSELNLNIYPAFVFFPSPKWSIEASIGNINYNHRKFIDIDSRKNSFNLNYGTISLALAYYFIKSKD
jgi:hypothetical protein